MLSGWVAVEELLSEVDVDCSSVAFNGKTVLMSPRAMHSYNTRTIVASRRHNLLRYHPEYEARLFKYSLRGFWIADRELKTREIKAETLEYAKKVLLKNPERPRLDVQGALLLITASIYPEVRQQLKVLRVPFLPFFLSLSHRTNINNTIHDPPLCALFISLSLYLSLYLYLSLSLYLYLSFLSLLCVCVSLMH